MSIFVIEGAVVKGRREEARKGGRKGGREDLEEVHLVELDIVFVLSFLLLLLLFHLLLLFLLLLSLPTSLGLRKILHNIGF